MKVNLAVQTLSRSVADSIDFCRSTLKLKDFKGSEATTKFLRMIDKLFDIMNSQSIFGKGFKAPMRSTNEHIWSAVFSDGFKYLSELKTLEGKKLIHSLRKAAFQGFLINTKSFSYLFDELVKKGKLNYLLTYKTSQDHLELFFCALRTRLGSNNNPTAREFKHAYKKLLLHHEIRGNGGNSIIQDDTSILTFQQVRTDTKTKLDIHSDCDYLLQQKYGLDVTNSDHDYSILSRWPAISEFQNAVLEYISGYCVKMAEKLLSCNQCRKAVLEETNNKHYSLVNAKDRGGLIHVNSSVKAVCQATEKTLKKVLLINQKVVPTEKNLTSALTSSVLKQVLEQHQ